MIAPSAIYYAQFNRIASQTVGTVNLLAVHSSTLVISREGSLESRAEAYYTACNKRLAATFRNNCSCRHRELESLGCLQDAPQGSMKIELFYITSESTSFSRLFIIFLSPFSWTSGRNRFEIVGKKLNGKFRVEGCWFDYKFTIIDLFLSVSFKYSIRETWSDRS